VESPNLFQTDDGCFLICGLEMINSVMLRNCLIAQLGLKSYMVGIPLYNRYCLPAGGGTATTADPTQSASTWPWPTETGIFTVKEGNPPVTVTLDKSSWDQASTIYVNGEPSDYPSYQPEDWATETWDPTVKVT
jgi:hypothetical protein